MKPDITSRENIYLIISNFYQKLIDDEDTFPFFENFILNKTLEKHLYIITDFWEDILFNTTKYQNNVLQKHLNIIKKTAFNTNHFNAWMLYFTETIDHNFAGLNAELMKNRAKSIATVMKIKLDLYQ